MKKLKICLISAMFLLTPSNQFESNTLNDSEVVSTSSEKRIGSPKDEFEFGFFKTSAPSADRWYIGIWYKNIDERTYVWVANRDNPLSNTNGTLQLSNGNLVIHDPSINRNIWSSSSRRNERSLEVVAELLDNGNFVLRDSNNSDLENYLWQSFDEPTDTLLPEMKLRWHSQKVHMDLTSWRSTSDPASGDHSFRFNTRDFPVLSIWERASPKYRSGPWNGTKFIGAPTVFRLTWSRERIQSFSITTNATSFSRLCLSSGGTAILYTWNQSTKNWDSSWSSTEDKCEAYAHCRRNSYCDRNTASTTTTMTACQCIKGFEEPKDATTGCVRKRPLNNGQDGFLLLMNMNIPDFYQGKRYNRISGIEECQKMCLSDLNCTAFSITLSLENGSLSCVTWSGDLLDLQHYSDEGQNLYVKLGLEKKTKIGLIISLCVGIPGLAILSFAFFCYWKRKQKRARATAASIIATEELPRGIDMSSADVMENQRLPPMDFATILKATENFSNVIGQGGFGQVYKGRLLNGQEIAVKKLSKISSQGTDEFYTEVKLIATLQHINIVRLLGWSVHKDEMVLVYEYLENGSLERHLFGEGPSSGELNWHMRFEIIKGIAQGLAYMEEGSHDMIVHRDLKPANVLLDRDMTPKISDFGMARICKRSENEATTTRTAGTYGYMSPEYAVSGRYSKKSDIFSFGVMVLEIISGKRNRTFSTTTNLLSHIWTEWKEGNWEESVDHIIRDSSSPFPSQQIRRCIEIGLLCVQQVAEDRPDMTSVVMMLLSVTCDIPQPQHPGFFMAQNLNDIPSTSHTSAFASASASASASAAAAAKEITQSVLLAAN